MEFFVACHSMRLSFTFSVGIHCGSAISSLLSLVDCHKGSQDAIEMAHNIRNGTASPLLGDSPGIDVISSQFHYIHYGVFVVRLK